jgi:hypothetical protein
VGSFPQTRPYAFSKEGNRFYEPVRSYRRSGEVGHDQPADDVLLFRKVQRLGTLDPERFYMIAVYESQRICARFAQGLHQRRVGIYEGDGKTALLENLGKKPAPDIPCSKNNNLRHVLYVPLMNVTC